MPRHGSAPKFWRLVILATAVVAALPFSAWTQNAPPVGPDEVVLSVGERKITAAEFDAMLKALPPDFQAVLAAFGKKGFAEQIANLLSLAMEAQKQNLDQTPEFDRMVELNRQVLLAQLMTARITQQYGAVGPEEVNYFYQTHQQDFEQAKVTGIYIPFGAPGGASSAPRTASAMPQLTEQQAMTKALQLRARIQSGQSMTELAKIESQHPTAAKGGDFGYISRNAQGGPLPPNLVTAIVALQATRVSAPLKSGNGFFLFRMESKRIQPLEELQPQIQAILGREKLNRHIEIIKQNYPITLHPGYFTEAEPPSDSAPPAR